MRYKPCGHLLNPPTQLSTHLNQLDHCNNLLKLSQMFVGSLGPFQQFSRRADYNGYMTVFNKQESVLLG